MEDLTREMTKKEARALSPEQKKARRKAYMKAYMKTYNKSREYTPERKEYMKVYSKAYQSENKAKIKEHVRAYNAKPGIKERKKAYSDAHYASKNTHFVTYKHTNSKGDIYLGSGTNHRPYRLHNSVRSTDWIATYSDSIICIDVLDTFDTKQKARKAERDLISQIGLSNLVNVYS
tara:strand:- start:92 stop:619 length:528 start_codon:yes stop_codon:yes gene_type:complete